MAVDTPHPEYLEFAGKWAKARDAAAGEEAVKARRDEYLRRSLFWERTSLPEPRSAPR